MTIEEQGAAFIQAIDGFFDVVRQRQVNLELVFRKIMIDLFNAIVLATPVDTGQARAGWRLQGGGLDYSMTLSSEGDVTVNSQPSIVQNFRTGSIPGAPAQVYRFENSVFHIVFLERGSSNQAPSGIVEVNLRRATARIDQAIRAATRRNQ